MTSPGERPNSAVLVIDVQTDVVAHAHDRDGVVANIHQVVAKARSNGAPVIWIQHDDDDLPHGSPGWQIVDELDPSPGEPIVEKNFRDSFESTTLEAELEKRQVGRLIVTGAQTDFCVRWTLHEAHSRGYDTVLVSNGHTTDELSPAPMPSGEALIAHTNSIWASQTAPAASASVVAASEISF